MKFKQGKKSSEYDEKVISIDRVCRTVKGGRRMSFRALVAIGNKKGKVGIGVAKAKEVLIAVNKAVAKAKKNLIEIQIVNGTIPHEIAVDYGSAKLFMKPASLGTSLIAGGSVRSILELVGIKNILTKIIGSSNKINNAKATIIALQSLDYDRALKNRSESKEDSKDSK
jgi:small subunit ribosomal protein S5